MDPPNDIKSILETFQGGLITTTKSINRLASEDLAFHRTVNPNVGELLSEQSARLFDLSNRLLYAAATACNVRPPPALEDVDDLDLNWGGIVDVLDSMLERVDMTLDEYKGLLKRKEPPVQDAAPAPKKSKPLMLDRNIRNANVTKPQVTFERPVNNFPDSPWRPILESKPHAMVPLPESLVLFEPNDITSQYKHPYEPELVSAEYPTGVYEQREPVKYKPVEATGVTWVDTFEGVLDMLEELKRADEIAVDLEHHDYRTYFGMVCLMQISTRENDWIVDTLKPWRHKLQVLNEVFADPKIVKVLHGAFMDVIWLQRDLGLYLNGLFDTYFACEVMYPSRSLAFLLKKFVDFDADKKYQMADWRARPLPEEMSDYARSDTHYLLYIYDQIRNELIQKSNRGTPDKDYIETVVQKSKAQALERYEHLTSEDNGEGQRGWRNLVLRNGWFFSGPQFSVFRAVWKWRDNTARTEDESPAFVLPQNAVLEISRVLPPDPKALHSLIPPNSFLAKQALIPLFHLVQAAMVRGEKEVSLNDYLNTGSYGTDFCSSVVAIKTPAVPNDSSIIAGRLKKSRLFGDMVLSSIWDDRRQPGSAGFVGSTRPDYIKLPWQKFIEEQSAMVDVKDDGGDTDGYSPHHLIKTEIDLGGKTDAVSNQAPPDEGFVLKPGAGRKTAAIDEDPAASSGSEDLEEGEVKANVADSPADSKGDGNPEVKTSSSSSSSSKALKRAKKAQKAAEKEARRAVKRAARQVKKAAKKAAKAGAAVAGQGDDNVDGAGGEEQGEEKPFDYTNAASVLRAPAAKRDGNTAAATSAGKPGNSGGAKKKVFNPYGDAGEDGGPKGARRAPPVQGGRTATFRK